MPMDIQALFRQHPVAVVGVAGGLAIGAISLLGKRGKTAATYPASPLQGTGSGSGFYSNYVPPPVPDPTKFGPCNGPLAFLDPSCRAISPAPTPHPAPYPGPTPDPCSSVFNRFLPGCGPSPNPPPDPSLADYSYMKAIDTTKSDMSMRMGVPWA